MPLKVVSFIRAIPVFAKLIKQIECYGDLFICRDRGFDSEIKRSNELDMDVNRDKDFVAYIMPAKGLSLSMKREVLMELEI